MNKFYLFKSIKFKIQENFIIYIYIFFFNKYTHLQNKPHVKNFLFLSYG